MQVKDMTVGKPFKTLLVFVLPMILSVTLQQLYNIADNFIAGNFINNSYSFSAVGTVYPVTVVFLDIAVGFGVGCGISSARYFGAKDYTKVKKGLFTALISMLVLAVAVTVVGVIVIKPVLSLMIDPVAEPECFSDALAYMTIYIFGMLFLFVYNVCMNIFQALGNSKTPLYFLMFSTVLNVGLDLLFVTAFGMESDGLALGTLISEAVAGVLSLAVLMKSVLKLSSDKVSAFDKSILKDIARIGVPSIFQGLFISVGGVLVMSFISGFGNIYVAGGYSAAYKVCYIAINIFSMIGNAISNFVSQNIGAGEYERVIKGFSSGLIIAVAFCAIATVLILPFREWWVNLFLSDGYTGDRDTVIETGNLFILTVVPFFLSIALKIPFDGVLKGSGDMSGFMAGTCIDLVLRIGCSYLFGKLWGYQAIFWAWPVGWIVGFIVSASIFFTGGWKKKCGYKIR